MADQKQQSKPKSPSSFWTVVETFGSHFAEAGAGYAQSCLIRGCVLVFLAVFLLVVFVAFVGYAFDIVGDNQGMLNFLSLLMAPVAVLAVWVFIKSGDIRDIEPLQELSEIVRQDRERPAIPQNVTIVGSAPALTEYTEEDEEEAA